MSTTSSSSPPSLAPLKMLAPIPPPPSSLPIEQEPATPTDETRPPPKQRFMRTTVLAPTQQVLSGGSPSSAVQQHHHPPPPPPPLSLPSLPPPPPPPPQNVNFQRQPDVAAAAGAVLSLKRSVNGGGDAAVQTADLLPEPAPDLMAFRYTWTVRPQPRALSADDTTLLHCSPKFVAVHDHVSFQWIVRLHGVVGRASDVEDEDGTGKSSRRPSRVTIAKNGASDDDDGGDDNANDEDPGEHVVLELCFLDGPVQQAEVRARVCLIDPHRPAADALLLSTNAVWCLIARGQSCEPAGRRERAALSDIVHASVGQVLKVAVLLELCPAAFEPFAYLDKVTPTPTHSFLTANYNARLNSKVWRRSALQRKKTTERSRRAKVDYEAIIDLLVQQQQQQEAESNAIISPSAMSSASPDGLDGEIQSAMASRRQSLLSIDRLPMDSSRSSREHLFKRLLVTCCDGCQRRCSLAAAKTEDEYGDDEDDEALRRDENKSNGGGGTVDLSSTHFECSHQDKKHVHDTLAALYFNRVALPKMEYVEDFVDFLIDAELHDLPVLKRACERYLCHELHTKQDLLTVLLLEMLFIAIVFKLSVMKSMTLSELASRVDELRAFKRLLADDEDYRRLDKKMRSLSDRNLAELVEQCLAFAEQCQRVTVILPRQPDVHRHHNQGLAKPKTSVDNHQNPMTVRRLSSVRSSSSSSSTSTEA